MCVCVCVCVCVCLYCSCTVCVCVLCAHACLCICMYACLCVHTYCVYVCVQCAQQYVNDCTASELDQEQAQVDQTVSSHVLSCVVITTPHSPLLPTET